MATNWNDLRPFKNSLNSAFEELCCQLAEYEKPPEGARFIRKGTPDAGIECFWILPTGAEWGWQAKFLFPPFTPIQWRQLDKSVLSALKNHPNLTTYTICLPFDRSDPKGRKGHKSFLDLWNERVQKWQRHTRKLRGSVDFKYWGDHEIHERLAKEEHAGRYKFWFDKDFLSSNWFANHIKEVIANVGDRYTPVLNIDLPIAQVFDGLGRTPEFFDTIDALHGKIRKAFRGLSFSKLAETTPFYGQELQQCIPALFALLGGLRLKPWTHLPFTNIAESEIKSTQQCIQFLRQQQANTKTSKAVPSVSSSVPDLRDVIFQLHRLLDGLHELRQFALSICAIAANRPSLLIVGGAGSGKTHLICDIADHRIKNGRPTLVLLGEQFRNAEPWKQILDLLNLDCTREQLLGALDAAALAAGTRALISIDALNEGEGKEIWSKHLAGMLAHLESYPRIGIVLTVRNSYEQVVVPQQLVTNKTLVREEHRGFEEHEYEAVNRFFTHFGIEPSVPLLYPEFTNPQFLLLFCRGLKNKGLSRIPPGLHGISSIFDFYLDSINDKLARAEYLDFDPSDRIVQTATENISKLMAKRAGRWLPREQARKSINAVLPNQEYGKSLFRHLIAEGIFAEDLIYAGKKAKPERIIRFSYERFADHRIARLMLDAHFNFKRPKYCFAKTQPLGKLFKDNYTYWTNQGLIEALCIQIPERFQKELPQLLLKPSDNANAIRTGFVDSLLWRTRSAFNDFTFKYINDEVLQYPDSRQQFWSTAIALAPVPGHPLNANLLHKHLSNFSMSDRDAWWTIFIHRQYRTQSSIDRILDWAWSPLRTQNLEADVAILYATTLSWLLTSSNRFLRDHATKNLVNVIGKKSEVLLAILDRFRTVNDPYVLERLCAVAYGCAMKMDNVVDLKALATAVYKWFFANGKPYSHILFRDYSRGVIEAAVSAGAQIEFDLSKVRPPYRSTWPKAIPSASDLETKYGWRKDKMPDTEWARLSIYSSVMGLGDFTRYVIGTNYGSFDWSMTRLGKPPSLTPKDKYEQFFDKLDRRQKKAWQRVQDIRWKNVIEDFKRSAPDPSKPGRLVKTRNGSLRQAEKAFEAALSSSELRTYRKDVLAYLAKPNGDADHFDLTLAQRWILQRVFDLGWSVDKFGTFDRDANANWSRDAEKPERIGKKYQWIAYHEFLGLVADHFKFREPFSDDTERKYEGPWQTSTRDIDPSCTLRKIPGGNKSEEAWWCPKKTYEWNSEDKGTSWISRTDDLPKAEPLIETSNPEDGSKWLVLEVNPEWKEPIPKYESEFDIPERWLWYQIRTFLVERQSAAKAFAWLSKQHFWGRWMPENPDYHSIFLGEFYWAPALRTNGPIFNPPKDAPQSRQSGIPCPLVFTAGSYHAGMNSFDCSMEEKFSVYLPGGWLVNKMGLQWNGVEGHFFDSNGDLIAYDPAVSLKGSHALLIRKDRFLGFLKSTGYEVIWFLLGGKQILERDRNPKNWPGELQISGVYRIKGEAVAGGFRSKVITK